MKVTEGRPSVVVVEDDGYQAALAIDVLRAALPGSAQIESIDNARRLVERIGEWQGGGDPPDLIVLDWFLRYSAAPAAADDESVPADLREQPLGAACLARLRSNAATASVPVLVLSVLSPRDIGDLAGPTVAVSKTADLDDVGVRARSLLATSTDLARPKTGLRDRAAQGENIALRLAALAAALGVMLAAGAKVLGWF